jgi:hypothetical protein
MDRLKDFLAFIFGAICIFSFLAAAYQAWNEKLGSATNGPDT